MGYSQADKTESHNRILRIAAAKVREAGVGGIGVADLMKEAGLTHGGFYRHFDSRDDLVAEAIACALAHGEQKRGAVVAEAVECALAHGEQSVNKRIKPKPPFAALVDSYLSTKHRDRLATSCAIATLANDVARSSDRARAAYTEQVQRFLALIGDLLGKGNGTAARRQAVSTLCTLVGALTMARAVDDEDLSLEILQLAGDALKSQVD